MPQNILKPVFERNDERGLFRERLNIGTWESLIDGQMKAGAVMGNHYHKKTLVYFGLSSGSARIRTVHIDTGARDEFIINAGEGVILTTDEAHAIEYLEDSSFILLKSRRYSPDDPDTYHYEV
jgi:dTDP-4-dehydrorhamnose 3,5-epimerase-like enzyme